MPPLPFGHRVGFCPERAFKFGGAAHHGILDFSIQFREHNAGLNAKNDLETASESEGNRGLTKFQSRDGRLRNVEQPGDFLLR